MLSVLAQGTLVSDPQRRISAAGKPFCTALLRVPADDAEALLLNAIAFELDIVDQLTGLKKGDSCAVTGRGRLTAWTGRDGTERHGLGLTVDNVLTIYQAGKRRKVQAASRADMVARDVWAA
jgi:single-stranded DNA-binding protein